MEPKSSNRQSQKNQLQKSRHVTSGRTRLDKRNGSESLCTLISIIPDQVTRCRPVTPALRRLYQRVKRLPFEGGLAWLSFPREAGELPAPDILILDDRNRGFLLSAGDATPAQAEELMQPGLFDLNPATTDCAAKLRNAADGLAKFATQEAGSKVPRFLILPGLSDSTASSLAKELSLPESLIISGEPESLAEWLTKHALTPLESDVSHAMKATFNLESRIPPSFVPRVQTSVSYAETSIDPRLTAYLLDFDQEAWVKNDLIPNAEAFQAIKGTPARLITGVAGSGKSLALLYRAKMQERWSLYPTPQKALFVTHNKPLIGDLQWRFKKLSALHSSPETSLRTTEFIHFFRWCGTLHYQKELTPINSQDRRARIAKLVAETFPKSGLPDSFFIDEVSFIADQIEDTLEAYQNADRAGRGVALDRQQRARMHSLYTRYRGSLIANRETDWPFIVRMVWEKARSGRLKLPCYTAIYVDEAQFFAPVWFALLKACLDPSGGEIVVAADPTQGFLKRRLSWRSVGLNVVGRSARLQKSYRNTPAIQAFARRFYNSRIQNSEHLAEETILPTEGNYSENLEVDRDAPRLVKHRAAQDAILWAANESAACLKNGLSPEAMLVLIEDSRSLDALQVTMEEKVGRNKVAVLTNEAPRPDTIALSTLNAATGVERPVVILLGLDKLFESEGDPRVEPQQRTEMIRDHTRKIYMALTRAGEKLLISYRHDQTRQILEGQIKI